MYNVLKRVVWSVLPVLIKKHSFSWLLNVIVIYHFFLFGWFWFIFSSLILLVVGWWAYWWQPKGGTSWMSRMSFGGAKSQQRQLLVVPGSSAIWFRLGSTTTHVSFIFVRSNLKFTSWNHIVSIWVRFCGSCLPICSFEGLILVY